MNKYVKYFVTTALCAMSVVADAANIRDYPTVAVMNFGNKAITSRGLRDHDFSSATEYAIYQLSASGWFDLVDYEQLSTIAKMHTVNMSGLVDPNTAVAIGKFAGAKFMVVGNLTGLTTKENVFGYQHADKGGINNSQHVVTANVAVRIVDIETGRIIVSGLGTGSSTSTLTELHFKKYRKNKIETENVSESITTDIIDEVVRNTSTTKNKSTSQDSSVRIGDNSSTVSNSNTSNTKETTSGNSVTNTKENNVTNSTTTTNEQSANSSQTHSDDYSRDINDTTGHDEIVKKEKSVDENTSHSHDDNKDITTTDDNVLDKKYTNELTDPYEKDDKTTFNKVSINEDNTKDTSSTSKKNSDDTTTSDTSAHSDNTRTNNSNTSGSNASNSSTSINNNSNSSIDSTSSTQSKNTTETEAQVNSVSSTNNKVNERTTTEHSSEDISENVSESVKTANNQSKVQTSNKSIYYERETLDYAVQIGTVVVSDIQVRNAISKAVRDSIYGRTGILTTLNNGKPLKIKTGF